MQNGSHLLFQESPSFSPKQFTSGYPPLTVVCIPPGCFDWPLLQDDELLEVHDHVHGQERSHPIPSPVLIQIRRIRRHGRRRRRRQIRRLHLLRTPKLYQ